MSRRDIDIVALFGGMFVLGLLLILTGATLEISIGISYAVGFVVGYERGSKQQTGV